jgi:cytochrome c553
MPDFVKYGRKPDARACAFCHLANGQGRPENASLAGLPAAYIEQQIADWQAGLRGSSEPKMGAPMRMGQIAKAVTPEEARIAAEYFSQLTYKQWIRVVESETVPKFRAAGSVLVLTGEAGAEPLGQRIVEVPEDLERFELRDSRSGSVAYVPVGSIQKGAELVTTGGGKTIRCSICHGADLKGLGFVPPLAGRSPSTIVRQLYNMQSGARNGPWSQLMKEVVARLTMEDMIAIAAYTSSRTP